MGRKVGTDWGFLGHFKDLRLGRIFKNEKPLEHFEPRRHTLTYILIDHSLLRRVDVVGEGCGQRKKQGDQFGRYCNNPSTRGWCLVPTGIVGGGEK